MTSLAIEEKAQAPRLASRCVFRGGALSPIALPWLLPGALIAAWQASASLGWLTPGVLPPPSAVAAAAWKLALSGELAENVEVSALRAFSGFAVGGGVGFALGLANGLSHLCERLTDSTLQMARNIPHLALIPLVILWFGIDEGAKLFLVALGVFFLSISTRCMACAMSTPNWSKWVARTACRISTFSGASFFPARCLRFSSGSASGSA